MRGFLPNDAGQWRAASDARLQTECLSARPLHQPGWAHGWAQGKLGVNRCVIAYTNITDRPRPPIPPQMPSSAAQRSGATNRHRRSMNQLNTPLPTRARNANGNVHTESYSDINSRMSKAVPKQHGRNTATLRSRRKYGCSMFMAASAPNDADQRRRARDVRHEETQLRRPLNPPGYTTSGSCS